MKITIEKQIIKKSSEVMELFSYKPKKIKNIINKDLNYLLKLIYEKLSISPEYELLRTLENENAFIKIYKFEENKKFPIQSINFSFKYIPAVTKKCKNCKNLYKNNYCLYKNKQIDKNFFPGCWGFYEKGKYDLDLDLLNNIKIF